MHAEARKIEQVLHRQGLRLEEHKDPEHPVSQRDLAEQLGVSQPRVVKLGVW